MIVQRFLAAFFPAAVFHNTRRLSLIDGETFLTEGKILVEPGWKAIYGSVSEEEGEKELQALPASVPVRCDEIDKQQHQTKPQPRFNEATLLSAMEHSGKLVEDEELAEAMKGRGLGTPATRAAIIEKLINEKYVVREQRELVPTGKAVELMSLLEARQIDVLASPELTGDWEYKLSQILKGSMTRPQFMKEISEMTSDIVSRVREGGGSERREAPFSPVDDKIFYETASAYESADQKIIIRKVLGGRVMEKEEIVTMIRGETLGPFADFRSKKGKPFTASVRLTNNKVEFLFADSTAGLDLDAIRGQEPLGESPIDRTMVFETPSGFLSDSALDGDQKKGLRISKMILERQLDPDHIRQLLTSGRTELITGFISKRKKPFDAYLLLDAKGKLTFEFPPRVKKGTGKKAVTDKERTDSA
jgi:DNA topoisomerase-3